MSKQVSIATARNTLPSLVRAVEHGPPVELTRRGRPVAVLVSSLDYRKLTRSKDLWLAIEEFRSGRELAHLALDEIYLNVRDRSAGREVPD